MLFNRSGYTLMEILLVLALFALVAGLAGPRLTQVYDSLLRAGQRDDILQQISGLGFTAFQRGEKFEISAPGEEYDSEAPGASGPTPDTHTSKAPLELPDGWRVTAEEAPVVYLPNGVCRGGRIRLEFQGRTERFDLNPPACRPEAL